MGYALGGGGGGEVSLRPETEKGLLLLFSAFFSKPSKQNPKIREAMPPTEILLFPIAKKKKRIKAAVKQNY